MESIESVPPPDRSTAKRRGVRLAGIVTLVVAALAVTALATRSAGHASGPTKAAAQAAATTTTLPADLDMAKLSQMATAVAKSSEGATPVSAQAVVTTRDKVLAHDGDSGEPGAASTKVVVLQVHGRFTMNLGAKPAPDSRPGAIHMVQDIRTFDVNTYTMTPDLKHTLDIAEQPDNGHVLDLNSLGSQVVDVPVG